MYWYSNLCTSKDTFTTNDKCLEVSESCYKGTEGSLSRKAAPGMAMSRKTRKTIVLIIYCVMWIKSTPISRSRSDPVTFE